MDHNHHNHNLSYGPHHHHHRNTTSPRTTTPPPPPPPTLSYPPLHRQNDDHEDKKNGILPTPVASNAVYGGGKVGELQQLSESLKLSPIGSRPKLSKAAAVSPSGVRYKECLKNHAASMGSTVVDGCGEFMPSGKEGTLEALKCAACQCHRNFHRREVESESGNFSRSLIVHPVHLQPPPSLHHHHQMVQPMAVAYGGSGGGTATESSSEDLVQVFDEMPLRDVNHQQQQQIVEHGGFNVKKRFRTKFTPEQKEKMLEFAERLGWRLQRQDDEIVGRFCDEVGVRRQVLKVWMHNNKNTLKKVILSEDHQQQITQHHAPPSPPTPALPAQTTNSQVHLQPHHHHLLHLQHQQQKEHQALQGSS